MVVTLVHAWPSHEHTRPGHEKPKTENRTEFTETEQFGSRFGSDFSGTEITEVFSVLDLGKPKYRAGTEFT